MWKIARGVVITGVLLTLPATQWAAGAAQTPRRSVPAAPPAQPADDVPPIPDGTSPAELQRLFDAYAIVQAQQVLQLSDAQLPDFLTRLRALQEVRRRNQNERARIIQDLRRMADQARDNAGRERLNERLRALRDLESRSVTDVMQAVDRLDEVLDPVQRARLRVLEETIERRKLELLTRARQAARARRQR